MHYYNIGSVGLKIVRPGAMVVSLAGCVYTVVEEQFFYHKHIF